MTGAIGLGGTQAQIDELHRGFDFGSSRTGRARRESVRPLNSSSFAAPRRQELFSASTGGFPNVRGRRLMRNLLAAKASIVLRDGPIRFMGHFRGRNHPREIHRHQNRAHHRCPTVAFAGLVAASEADSSALIGSDFVPALAIAALATVAVSFLGACPWGSDSATVRAGPRCRRIGAGSVRGFVAVVMVATTEFNRGAEPLNARYSAAVWQSPQAAVFAIGATMRRSIVLLCLCVLEAACADAKWGSPGSHELRRPLWKHSGPAEHGSR
jgi:hypothetical protein